MKKYTITIGRQWGSGGRYIGTLLSQRLNVPCYDKELIQLASQESGLDKEFFEEIDEKRSYNFSSNFMGLRSGFMEYNEGNYLGNESLFKIQSDVIRKLASKESCIFVGRCADYILRDYRDCLKVFISANMKDRVRQVAQEEGVTEKEARISIDRCDKKRADYYNYYSNKVWGAATSYDLCFNSSFMNTKDIAALIADIVYKKFSTDITE